MSAPLPPPPSLKSGPEAGQFIDLGDLALRVVVRSVGHAALAILGSTVAMLIAHLVGYETPSAKAWELAFAIWLLIQLRVLTRLRRIAAQRPPVRSSARSIHSLHLTTAAFLLLFFLARPHLIAVDASAFPYVERVFQLFIGVTAAFHLVVLAIFATKPTKWDFFALTSSIIAALIPFLR